jgi:hypothetical protein
MGLETPDLTALSRGFLDDAQLKVLVDIAYDVRPHIREMALEWRSEIIDRILPSLEMAWGPEEAIRDATEFVEAQAARDMRRALEVARCWSKGLAEAGIPFLKLVQMLRLWEKHFLEFLFRTYRVGGLKQAIDSVGNLSHAYMVVAAQAYVEVYQLTVAHLQADLGEALSRPDILWWSFLESAEMLGLQGLQPRILAQRILERVEYPGSLEVRQGKFIHTGPHVMVHECPGRPDSCLSAFLAEAKVERMYNQVLNIEAIRLLPDNQCEVVLVPLLEAQPRPKEISPARASGMTPAASSPSARP